MGTIGYVRHDGEHRTAASLVYLRWGYRDEEGGYRISFGLWPKSARDLRRGGVTAWWIYYSVTFYRREHEAPTWRLSRGLELYG